MSPSSQGSLGKAQAKFSITDTALIFPMIETSFFGEMLFLAFISFFGHSKRHCHQH